MLMEVMEVFVSSCGRETETEAEAVAVI
jgi:hypothetical protein